VITNLGFIKKSPFWIPSLSYVLFCGLTIWGVLDQGSTILLVSSAIFSFLCWELLIFKVSLLGLQNISEVKDLINFHLNHLIPVIFIGWGICIAAIYIHFQGPFLILLLTGGIGIYGFFHFIRKASTP
jgi:hypothetical protein